MPPAVIPLALIAVGVPAALRALVGRPRALGAAWIGSAAAVAAAQAVGELLGWRAGLLGDAQLLAAFVAAAAASALVALFEKR